jgi:D-alanine-D-alanine ligase
MHREAIMKIIVLAGGLSPERDVSLSSGGLIANALMDAGHAVLLVDAYEGIKENASFLSKESGKRYSFPVPEKAPDLEEVKRRNGGRRELIGPGVLEACKAADVAFIGLHGDMGENGKLQAFLDVYGIRYTGSGYQGSCLAMDKDLSKRLMKQADVPTAEWILIDASADEGNKALVASVESTVGFPCVVKPCSCGSSVGISIVENREELAAALDAARAWENSILVERKISGREFSVGVLNGTALPPIEIVPKSGFYDYANKYQAGLSEEICPARLDADKTAELQRLTLQVHACLKLGSYSRIDFILDAQGSFCCLEANTLPGMTPTSLLPQEAAAAGMSYIQLCELISRLALEAD